MIEQVRDDLRDGRKRTHWMWFVFPQIAGLGFSVTSQRYAIDSLDEAAAYLAHPVLGPRLVECTRLVLGIEGRSLHDIFGSPDDAKFHSCVTLFEAVPISDPVFAQALQNSSRAGATRRPSLGFDDCRDEVLSGAAASLASRCCAFPPNRIEADLD